MKQSAISSDNVLDVLVIGAGFSGVDVGVKLLKEGIENFAIYEMADKIGGVWHHNRYPGVACDVASHLYCYSYEPNPNWSRVFSPGAEIRDYIESVAVKYGVSKHIHLGQKIQEIRFNDQTQYWDVSFVSGDLVSARFVVNGSGGLHAPNYAGIQGRETFKGASMHSARWDSSVQFEGKRVAVVGSAASAVQLVPELAKVASELKVFQRTPNYIMPRQDREFTEKEKSRYKRFPLLSKLYRTALFYKGELLSYPLVKNKGQSKYSAEAKSKIDGFMKKMVKNRSYHESLTPSYPVGCKRVLLSDNFFSTFNKDNVELVAKGVNEIVEDGLIDAGGDRHEVDIIVYATGYDIDKHMFSIPIYGSEGRSLEQYWRELPRAYEAACVAGFPNLFFTTGPNSGVGTTSVVYMIEKQVNYIIQAIKAAGADKLIEVRADVMNEYNDEIQSALQQTVWAAGCSSYYRRDDGKIATLYPYNARAFKRRHKKLKIDQYQITDRELV